MMPLKTFNEYVKEGMVRKQFPDKFRANSLITESEDSYKILLSFVEKIGVDDNNANHIIKNAYDIIMELIRANMILDGFITTGKGAHEAEVSYMIELSFSNKDVDFANELRYFRNGIMYYGKKFDKTYAEKVLRFTNRLYPLLKKIYEKSFNNKRQIRGVSR
ncbi:MAG: hypothetical protein J4473_06015 [Candidatus Aenigmarchaeota archaeon]|nr:hypothetical protein [Candidatus Aenigmarchaeota archaeon]